MRGCLPPHQFAVVAATFGVDLREAVRRSREAGFAGVQLDAYGAEMRIPDLSGSGRREVRQFLANQDQHLVGLRVDLGPRGFGPGSDADRLLHNLERAMEAASDLAAALLCVDAGRLPEPACRRWPSRRLLRGRRD